MYRTTWERYLGGEGAEDRSEGEALDQSLYWGSYRTEKG